MNLPAFDTVRCREGISLRNSALFLAEGTNNHTTYLDSLRNNDNRIEPSGWGSGGGGGEVERGRISLIL